MSYSVALIHGHPLIRWAVQQILGGDPDIRVLTPHGLGGDDMPANLDAVITDAPLRGRIPGLLPETKVLLLTDTGSAADQPWPCIDERSSPGELVSAVLSALGDGAPAGTGIQGRLSDREHEVLQHIAAGLTHGQTAHRLGISPHTVDTHIRRIRAKLGAGNKAQLTRAALVRST